MICILFMKAVDDTFLYIIILFLYAVTELVWFAAHRAWLLCAQRRDSRDLRARQAVRSTECKYLFSYGS